MHVLIIGTQLFFFWGGGGEQQFNNELQTSYISLIANLPYSVLSCDLFILICLVDISVHQHCIFSNEATISANLGQKPATHMRELHSTPVYYCTPIQNYWQNGEDEVSPNAYCPKIECFLWWYHYRGWQGIVTFRGWSIAYCYMLPLRQGSVHWSKTERMLDTIVCRIFLWTQSKQSLTFSLTVRTWLLHFQPDMLRKWAEDSTFTSRSIQMLGRDRQL